jgi:hypothetical protein
MRNSKICNKLKEIIEKLELKAGLNDGENLN